MLEKRSGGREKSIPRLPFVSGKACAFLHPAIARQQDGQELFLEGVNLGRPRNPKERIALACVNAADESGRLNGGVEETAHDQSIRWGWSSKIESYCALDPSLPSGSSRR